METTNQTQASRVSDSASDLLHEGKKWAEELRDDGMKKLNEAEINIKESTDKVVKNIQENPISAVLIAAGVGFVLSKLFGK